MTAQQPGKATQRIIMIGRVRSSIQDERRRRKNRMEALRGRKPER